MSEILTNNKYYKDIADTIRQMKGVTTTYKPREMAGALRDIYSTEVEGVPPLTFPSNGNNLLNYRIDGASGGVGDRTANLFDYNWLFDYEQKRVNEYFNYIQITLEPNTTYYVTSDYDYNQAQNATAFIVVNSNTAITTANGGVFGSRTVTTTQDGILKIARRTKGNNEAMIPKREDFENNSKHIQISINPVNDENYEPYGKYKVPAIISGKNLFDENSPLNTNKSVEAQNDVFPASSGGNRRTYFYIAKPNTTYTYSCDTSGDRFVLYEFNRIINLDDYTTPNNLYPTKKIIIPPGVLTEYTFTTAENTKMVGIYYALNTIPTNIQIEVGNAKTTYKPYIEPTTTNIYLDEPIEANESKSLSDTNVNIPTINGTNILSIDTTVQPSNVYVQAPKTNNYNL